MGIIAIVLDRMNIVAAFRELGGSRQRVETLLALAASQLLVQLTFLPVTLATPSVGDYFGVDVDDAAWTVIIRLLMLGSTVFLTSRLGERFGHVRIFFLGIVVLTVSNLLATTSQSLLQLIIWCGMGGFGGALIIANSNAIIALVYSPNERGRAFAVPVTASRFGTLIGLLLFGLFLEYISWRLVYMSALVVGVAAIWFALPVLKYQSYQWAQSGGERAKVKIDYLAAAVLVAVLGTFILSGSHLHDGAESFTTPDALSYHLPMHILSLALAGLFVVLQLRSATPFLDFRYFKRKYFSMALYSNTTCHMSMLVIFTLVPIVVEDGLGYSPLVVMLVLLPHQTFGLWVPAIAGYIYDKYNPRWMGPMSLFLIASGVALLGLFANQVPIWGVPLLLLPASIGTALFISPYNAVVMNTLPDNRSFASGMLETTRQMGHTVGSTLGAAILGLSLPVAAEFMTAEEARPFYQQGFQIAALSVVWIIISGGIVALFQRVPGIRPAGPGPTGELSPQPGGDD